MRPWYARRGIPWTPLLACCALALACAAAGQRWPDHVAAFLPEVLAVCAAGAGFVFDEPAGAVVAVTPRGAGWRRTTRLAVCILPLAAWLAVVVSLPADAGVHRAAWSLVGLAVLLLVVAGAALASRAQVGAPGTALASIAAMALIGPHVMNQFLGWAPFPFTGFPGSVLAFWVFAAGVGTLACAWALRPGLR